MRELVSILQKFWFLALALFTMGTGILLIDNMSTVPAEFWYACTMILAAILIWIIQRYFASLQTTIKDLADSIKELTKIVTKHEGRLDQLENNVRRSTKR
jgi:surface polysaccharide O-acyltransferase-like enzyme